MCSGTADHYSANKSTVRAVVLLTLI